MAAYQDQLTTQAKWDFANGKDANLSILQAMGGNTTTDAEMCRARESREEQQGSRQKVP